MFYFLKLRLSVWTFNNEALTLIFISEVESERKCLFIEIFDSKVNFIISTIEARNIKFWKIEENRAICTNKINVKEEIVKAKFHSHLNCLFVLTKNNRIFVLNRNVYFEFFTIYFI